MSIIVKDSATIKNEKQDSTISFAMVHQNHNIFIAAQSILHNISLC